LKAPKTSGGGRTPVRHTIPLGIVIFIVKLKLSTWERLSTRQKNKRFEDLAQEKKCKGLVWGSCISLSGVNLCGYVTGTSFNPVYNAIHLHDPYNSIHIHDPSFF